MSLPLTTQNPIELPPGWKAGYGHFNSDTGMDTDVFTHEGRKLMVRFSYKDDGFTAYTYYPEIRRHTGVDIVARGTWYPLVGTPSMPDALSLITWLMVEGVV